MGLVCGVTIDAAATRAAVVDRLTSLRLWVGLRRDDHQSDLLRVRRRVGIDLNDEVVPLSEVVTFEGVFPRRELVLLAPPPPLLRQPRVEIVRDVSRGSGPIGAQLDAAA